MSRTHSPNPPSLHLRHSSFSDLSVASPTSQLIFQPFRRFTYVTAHSTTLPLLHLRHSLFSNLPLLDLRHSSFSDLSVTSPTSQLILQPFRRFTYVTAHSLILPSLHLRHSSFSNPPVASPTLQLILQPFFRFSYVVLQPYRHFTYVTAHYPTLPSFCLRHSSFSNPSVASPTSQLIL